MFIIRHLKELDLKDWALVVTLTLFAIAFCYIGASFTAQQSVRLTAKQSIEADIASLAPSTPRSDREIQALAATLSKRSDDLKTSPERLYFLSDDQRIAIAGNLEFWPEHAQPYNGWHDFALTEANLGDGKAYAQIVSVLREASQPSYKLLVGRKLADQNIVFHRIFPVFLGIGLLCVTCGCFIYRTHSCHPRTDS